MSLLEGHPIVHGVRHIVTMSFKLWESLGLAPLLAWTASSIFFINFSNFSGYLDGNLGMFFGNPLGSLAFADTPLNTGLPSFLPCSPESEPIQVDSFNEPSSSFCEKWNPDFLFNGNQCCGKATARRSSRKMESPYSQNPASQTSDFSESGRRYHSRRQRTRSRHSYCSPRRIEIKTGERFKGSYCSDITPEQIEYTNSVQTGKIPDILAYLALQMGRFGDQAFCTVNNGFLAHGRRIISTSQNRIFIRSPDRCAHFGTDAMVGMLEWLGRQVASAFPGEENSGVQLSIGDVAAPKGGCLLGSSGRRGHSSHTTGQDADVGFLDPKAGKRSPPAQFTRSMEVKSNWWLLKKIFKNPFACIKVIFLDRHHIRALERYASSDPLWRSYHRFIRHMPGHRNHFHVRIGNGPGDPGCIPGAQPELESEEDADPVDLDETSILEQLSNTRQEMDIQE